MLKDFFMLEEANNYNPSLQQLRMLIKVHDEQIKEAQSEFYPKVGLFGSANNMYNSYDNGLNHKDNQNSWTIGFGVTMSLFNGFRDKYKLLEKKLHKYQTTQKLYLFEEAVALQIKNAFIQSHNNYKQIEILEHTKKVALENTELNIEGYQVDMISTADVIQAQLTQSYTNADYAQSVYNYQISMAKLQRLIGQEHEKINDMSF